MRSATIVSLTLVLASSFSGSAAQEAETLTINPQDISLLQTTAKHGQRSVDKNQQTPSIDGAHLVCHKEGCAEVKAKLAVVEKRVVTVQGKLADCSKHRKQLEADLAAAAKNRAVAEKALAECAAERKKLSDGLKQCGVDRAKAEKALAECSRDRAKLEAELKQCATVDRPNAEKALAKCGVERAALEKELMAVIAKLKAGGGSAKPSSAKHRRRRRRSKKRSSASLVEVASQETENDETESEEDLSTRRSEIETRLAELATERESLEKKILDLGEQEAKAKELWDKVSGKFFAIMAASKEEEEKERSIQGMFQALDDKEKKTIADFDASSQKAKLVKAALAKAAGEESKALQDVNSETLLQLKTQKELVSLLAEVRHLHEEEAQQAHKRGSDRLAQLSTEIEAKSRSKEHDEEECDDLRAKVIEAQGKLTEASGGLQKCLTTKKVIQKKLDAVEAARMRAQQGLDACLATKARLKTALDECHKRRDAAREKLQLCLDRKKELKPKIELCHQKRDEAREKLAACLAKKKELKEKIAAAMKKVGPTARSSSLLELTDEMDGIQEQLETILAELQKDNGDFDISAREMVEVGNSMRRAVKEMLDIGAEDDSITAELTKIDEMEFSSQQGQAEMQTQLSEAMAALKRADSLAKEAAASAQAAEKAVDEVEGSLLELESKSAK